MAKKRVSLADIMQEAALAATDSASAARGLLVPLVQLAPERREQPAVAATPVAQKESRGMRRDKPHTTIYLDPAVRLAIKRIALDYNKKPHDLMLEGIDMMLIKYTGKTSKEHMT